MEFEEMQAIWDTQHNEPLYVLNEKALHNRIVSKKHTTLHIAQFSEWLLIVVNLVAGGFVLGVNIAHKGKVFMYVMAAWLFCSALYVLINRVRRLQAEKRFDRSMLGDLQHAVATATYQVRLSHIMRWNVVPMGGLIAGSFWESGVSVWLIAGTVIFMALVFFASGWEHNIYKRKKAELEGLLAKLIEQ